MLELLHHAYYSSRPALCPPAFLRCTIFTTPVICAPVILPALSGTVNRACLSGRLGPGLELGWGVGGGVRGQRLNWGEWEEERRARVGGNELTAMQHCKASILTTAEREEEEERKMKRHQTDVLRSVFLPTSSACKSFCLFHSESILFWFPHIRCCGFRQSFTLMRHADWLMACPLLQYGGNRDGVGSTDC